MKHDRATEDMRELAALYALGSLTQHEARSFQLHMQEGCSVCQAEYRKYARTLAEMGFAAEEVPAPDYIRDLLIARAEREGRPIIKAPKQQAATRTEPQKERPLFAPSVRLFSSQQKQEKRNILPWILAIAVIVAAAAGYLFWKSSQNMNRQLQAMLEVSQSDIEALQKQVSSHKEKSEGLEEIWVIVNKPGARIARLIGQAATPSNVGAVLWDTKQGQCLAMGSFAIAPQGKIYQLWFFSTTKKVPIGLIKTDPAGRFFMKLPVPKDAESATAAVVTLEPENGSKIPATPYSAAGQID